MTAALVAGCWLAKAQAEDDVAFNDQLIAPGLLLYSPSDQHGHYSTAWTATTIKRCNEKVIVQARGDAALYVATDGRELRAYQAAALALLPEQDTTGDDHAGPVDSHASFTLADEELCTSYYDHAEAPQHLGLHRIQRLPQYVYLPELPAALPISQPTASCPHQPNSSR